MLDAFFLSLKLGLVSATVATLLAVPAALAISRYEFPGRGALTGFLLSALMIPSVVLGIAFLRFFSMAQIGGSFCALSITHVIVVLPYALRLTLASTIGLERDIEQAALSGRGGAVMNHQSVYVVVIGAGAAGMAAATRMAGLAGGVAG